MKLIPFLSEKTVRLAGGGAFTFTAPRSGSKAEIAEKVAKLYNVHVLAVRVSNLPAERIRRGSFFGWRKAMRRAIVTLRKGEKIAGFEVEEDKSAKSKDKNNSLKFKEHQKDAKNIESPKTTKKEFQESLKAKDE